MKHLLRRQFVITSALILISVFVINVQAEESGSSVPKPSVGILSEEVVRAQLSSAGYGEIQSIQRKHQYYVIETTRNGNSVRIKIDNVTGQIFE